jgi:tetratricopeptide (TPR) repeat protein
MPTRSLISCLLLVVATTSCSRDPNVVKARYLQNGNKYFERGKYKEASIMYRTALQKDLKYGDAHYRLALTELKMEQPVAAVGELRRAVELLKPDRPERTDARIKLADIYLDYLERAPKRETDVIDEVQRTIDDLLKADPKSVDGHRLKGRLFFIMADDAAKKHDEAKTKEALQNAIAEFKTANSLKPDQTNVVMFLAATLTANQQLGEAEKLYRGLVEKEKDNIKVYMDLYRMYMFQNQPDQAEAILKKAIENNPKRYELLISLAQHYYGRKRRDDVVHVLETLKSHAKDYPQAFEQAGAFYFRLGDGAEAMRQYEDGIKANPDRKAFYQKLIIEVLMAQGKREEAKKVNDQILTADSKDTDALSMQAGLLLDKGDLQNAVTQLQTVVTRAPANFVAHYNLGRGLSEKGDIEPARAQFNEALRLRPDYTPARLALAQIQLSKGEYEPAIKTADEILSYDRNNVRAHLLRAAAYLRSNQTAKAKDELKQVLDHNPNSDEAMMQMGVVLAAERKYKESEDAFRKCYDLNPANALAMQGLTEVMMAEKQSDRAIQTIRAEIQKYPTRPEFHLQLGNLYVRSGKLDLGMAEFNGLLDKADRKSPTAADLYVRLAETQLLAQNLPAAIESAKKAHDILPNNSMILNKLANLLTNAGQKNEAKAAYLDALRIDSENPVALNNLAYIIAESPGGDLNQALTFAQRANQKLPQAYEIADTLGWIYLKKNLPDNALELFRNNVSKVPTNPTYRYHLAMALYQKGDKAHARQELQTALTNRPSKEEEANIKELIGKI